MKDNVITLNKRKNKNKNNNDNNKLSSNFVGIVLHCETTAKLYEIKKGTRVASILPWEVNVPYLSISPQHLVAVPKYLDAAETACIIAYYLPAFQFLHHGENLINNNKRYKEKIYIKNSQKLLIRGCAIQLLKAIIRMSKYSGINDIYVIARIEEHELLKQLNVIPLDEDSTIWLPIVKNSMNIVLDCSFPKDFHEIKLSLASKGRLVFYPSWGKGLNRLSSSSDNNSKNTFIDFEYLYEWYQLSTIKRASIYDLEQSAELNRELMLDDFDFLLHLLETRKIRPSIDRFTTLANIPQLLQLLASSKKIRPGAIIGEP